MNAIDNVFIREFISTEEAIVKSKDYALEFNSYVCSKYNWDVTNSRIDWSNEEVNRLCWINSDEDEWSSFIESSMLGNYEFCLIIYGVNQPTLLLPISVLKNDLDIFMCSSNGSRYIVGVIFDAQVNSIELDCNSFIEVDGDKWLTCSK